MIVDVEKCLVIGVKEHLDLFFKKAQIEGIFEFLSPSGKKMQVLSKHIQDIITCQKILKKEGRRPKNLYGKEYTLEELVARILFLKNTLEKYHEEQRVLKSELLNMSHFGDFSLTELLELQKESSRVLQFFFRSRNKKDKPLPSDSLILISSDAHADYFLGIHEDPKYFSDFVEMHFEKEAAEVKKRLAQVEYDLKNYHDELKELTGYEEFLQENLIKEFNAFNLKINAEDVSKYFEGELFSVEAWIASEDLPKAFKCIQELTIHIERVSIEKQDRIPTCMKNKGLKKVGEDLVHIYDTPSYQDKDPSRFVIIFFAIFFAMIVADAGYGCVYMLLTLLAYFNLKKKTEFMQRMMKLFFMISSACIVWGILIGSYFGIHLSIDNPLQKFSVLQELIVKKASYHLNQQDDVYQHYIDKIPEGVEFDTPKKFLLSIKKQTTGSPVYEISEEFNNSILMEIAILTGAIHIIISLARYLRRNWASFGWILFIIGAYLYLPSMMSDATSLINFLGIVSKKVAKDIGLQLLITGVILAWVLALIQHKKKGLEEPLKSIQIFADILSYLRLYALSLAGIIMAATFNEMGREVGYAFGFFIIILGHTVNMSIAIMGGFIHGLRLNFLEWYHYSFEGGGKLFNPLRILK